MCCGLDYDNQVCLFICLFIYLFFRLFVCLFVCFCLFVLFCLFFFSCPFYVTFSFEVVLGAFNHRSDCLRDSHVSFNNLCCSVWVLDLLFHQIGSCIQTYSRPWRVQIHVPVRIYVRNMCWSVSVGTKHFPFFSFTQGLDITTTFGTF